MSIYEIWQGDKGYLLLKNLNKAEVQFVKTIGMMRMGVHRGNDKSAAEWYTQYILDRTKHTGEPKLAVIDLTGLCFKQMVML